MAGQEQMGDCSGATVVQHGQENRKAEGADAVMACLKGSLAPQEDPVVGSHSQALADRIAVEGRTAVAERRTDLRTGPAVVGMGRHMGHHTPMVSPVQGRRAVEGLRTGPERVGMAERQRSGCQVVAVAFVSKHDIAHI